MTNGSYQAMSGDNEARNNSTLGHSTISLEELVRMSETSIAREIQKTPRPSIASVALVDDFARTLFKINNQIAEMRHLTAQLGSSRDSHDLRAELNVLTEMTKEMIMKANQDLRELRSQPTLSVVKGAERKRLAGMTHDFQNMMRRFQDIQIFSLEKSRDFVVRAREIASTSPTSAETAGDDSAQKSEGGEKEPLLSREELGLQRRELQGLDNEISYNQALIQEREQGIIDIENAMADIHELFCDLGLLVGEQQDIIGIVVQESSRYPVDNIEANLEASAVRARAAVRELAVAQDNQRRRRGNYICCLLLLAAFVLIIVIALVNAIL